MPAKKMCACGCGCEDFGKEILGDDNALKTNPDSDVPTVDKKKKKVIMVAVSAHKLVGQPEPVAATIKNKYKTLAKNSDE